MWLALLLCVVPLWNHPYFEELRSPNPLSRTYLTRALWDHHTVAIDAVEREFGDVMDRSRRGPHTYCDKAPGSSFLLLPVYGALRVTQSGPVSHQQLLKWGSLWLGVFPTFLMLLCMDAMMVWLSIRRRARLVALCGLGLGGVGVPFELLFFGHQLVACLLVFTLWAGVRAVRTGRLRDAALAGLAAGWSVITEYPVALLVVVLAALCAALVMREPVARARRLSTLVLGVVLGALVPVGLGMAYHQAAFGGPFTTGYAFIENSYFASIHKRGFMGIAWPSAEALFGVLLSSSRGLFYFMPWLLLAPLGAWVLSRRGEKAWGIPLTVAMLAYVTFAAGFGYWTGGWCLGPRHLVPVIPPMVLLTAAALDVLEEQRALLASVARGLVVWSVVVVGLACVTHSGYPEEFAHPFFQMTLPLLWGGYHPYSLGTSLGWSRGASALVPMTAVVLTVLTVVLVGRRTKSPTDAWRAATSGFTAALFITVMSLLVRPTEKTTWSVSWIMDAVWEPREGTERKRADPLKVEPGFRSHDVTQDDRNHVGRDHARRMNLERALEEYARGVVDARSGRK